MKHPTKILAFAFCSLAVSGFGARAADSMNDVAERYVHLVLALGQHDPDYVDAFYGPAEWKTQAEKEKKSLDAIGAEADELSATLNGNRASPQSSPSPGRGGHDELGTADSDLLKLRREYLRKQISALAARVRMLKGEKLKFDDESRALYDAVAPTYRQSGSDGFALRADHQPTRRKNSGQGSVMATLRELAEAVCDSEGKTRYGVSTGDQGMSRPDAGARCAST